MALTHTPWGDWDPLTPHQVASLFAGAGAPWWIAGGYAIELALGRRVREHADVDVLLLRADELCVQRALPGWQWWAADPPGTLRPWNAGEILPPHVHDIWCRPAETEPWRVQVMLDESAGADWVSRRSADIRRPIATIGHTDADGIPYLATEIQLFYKAKAPRPKDEQDFAAALPALTSGQRDWLRTAIAHCHGAHPWLAELAPARGRG